jgi:hypothetical protein
MTEGQFSVAARLACNVSTKYTLRFHVTHRTLDVRGFISLTISIHTTIFIAPQLAFLREPTFELSLY